MPSRACARWRCIASLLALLSLLGSGRARAMRVDDLNPSSKWQVGSVSFSGNRIFDDDSLKAVLQTKERPFYTPWKARPEFDPGVFSQDLKRLNLFYEAHGYYHAKLAYDLTIRGPLVDARINIVEGKPVKVEEVNVAIDGYRPPANRAPANKIPLHRGDIFNQELYRNGQHILRLFFKNAGYARAKAQRRAQVDVVRDTARIWYTVEIGSKAYFGRTTLRGNRDIEPKIIQREIDYKEGEEFSQKKIEQARDRLLNLHLFSAVAFNPDLESESSDIPIDLDVHPKAPHEIRIGGGYSTLDDIGGQLQWHDYDWGGDGRQLSIMVRYALINSMADISLLQPYLLGDRDFQGKLEAAYIQQDWQTFILRAEQFKPQLVYNFTEQLTANFGYQIEYAQLNNVNPTVVQQIGGIRHKGILTGPTLGIIWNTTDNQFYPTRGGIVTFSAEAAHRAIGSDFSYYRTTLDLRKYTLIAKKTVLAMRVKFGLADAVGSRHDYPLWLRFFPGGDGSVRGYGYWRLGPKSASNDPVGGLSLFEGSVELRHPIYKQLAGAVFVDFGQTTTHTYTFPTPLRFGFGPAIMYETPIGPLRLDLGIPSRAPHGDPWWQVYFSIGQFF
jgi:outer membrane protein assembly complex protein YaeT